MTQADTKTSPTNPMKDLRIDKLVISASLEFIPPTHNILTLSNPQQIPPSTSQAIVSPAPPKSSNNSPAKPPSPPKPATPSAHSVSAATKKSPSTSPSAGPKPKKSSSAGSRSKNTNSAGRTFQTRATLGSASRSTSIWAQDMTRILGFAVWISML